MTSTNHRVTSAGSAAAGTNAALLVRIEVVTEMLLRVAMSLGSLESASLTHREMRKTASLTATLDEALHELRGVATDLMAR